MFMAVVNASKTALFFVVLKKDKALLVDNQYTLGDDTSKDWGEKYDSIALFLLFCLGVKTG